MTTADRARAKRVTTNERARIRWWAWAAGAGVTLLLLVLLGPRPTVRPIAIDVEVPESPAAAASWVREREARFDDIVEGTEARILWAGSDSVAAPDAPDAPDAPERTELAVVYLHGFSATHRETAPLTTQVAEALGANAYLTRLTGHGRTGAALGDATAEAWLRDAAEAVAVGRAIGDRVVLIGVSTGGTLAVWAAAQERLRDDIAALVLVSPNFRIADPAARILTWPWGGLLARLVIGPERSWEPHNELQARYWTTSYPTRVLPEMAALVALAEPELFAGVRAPTLLFFSPDDQIVDPDAAVTAFDQLGADRKELVPVTDATDPSSHVLAGRILSPGRTVRMAEQIVTFVRP